MKNTKAVNCFLLLYFIAGCHCFIGSDAHGAIVNSSLRKLNFIHILNGVGLTDEEISKAKRNVSLFTEELRNIWNKEDWKAFRLINHATSSYSLLWDKDQLSRNKITDALSNLKKIHGNIVKIQIHNSFPNEDKPFLLCTMSFERSGENSSRIYFSLTKDLRVEMVDWNLKAK